VVLLWASPPESSKGGRLIKWTLCFSNLLSWPSRRRLAAALAIDRVAGAAGHEAGRRGLRGARRCCAVALEPVSGLCRHPGGPLARLLQSATRWIGEDRHHLTLGLNGISLPLFVLAGVVGLAAGLYALQSGAGRLRMI